MISLRFIATALIAAASIVRADAPTTQPAADDAASPTSLIGKPAPDFKLQGLDGATHSFADVKGNVVLLDFWGTWCVPCHVALPHMDSLSHQYAAQGLKVFAIDNGDVSAQAQKYVTDNHISLTVLMDPDSAAVTAYKGGDEFPQTVVIGKDGIVKNVFIGYDVKKGDPAHVEQAIVAALGQSH
jgi:peroxiredoxin